MKKIKTTIIIVIAIVLVTTLAGCAIKIMLEGNAGGGSTSKDSEVISATESKSESVSESEEVSESTEISESDEQNSDNDIAALEFEQYKSFTVLQKDIWYKIDNTDANHFITLCSKDGSSELNYDYSKDKKLFEVRTEGEVDISSIAVYVNIGDYTYVKFTDDVSAYAFSIAGDPNTEHRVYVQKTA